MVSHYTFEKLKVIRKMYSKIALVLLCICLFSLSSEARQYTIQLATIPGTSCIDDIKNKSIEAGIPIEISLGKENRYVITSKHFSSYIAALIALDKTPFYKEFRSYKPYVRHVDIKRNLYLDTTHMIDKTLHDFDPLEVIHVPAY
jgi:hypothetical protein